MLRDSLPKMKLKIFDKCKEISRDKVSRYSIRNKFNEKWNKPLILPRVKIYLLFLFLCAASVEAV